MPHTLRSGAVGAVLLGILCMAAGGQAHGAAPVERGTWKHHHSTFSYYGLTALYTCDGLEEKVNDIYFGALAKQRIPDNNYILKELSKDREKADAVQNSLWIYDIVRNKWCVPSPPDFGFF